MQKKILVVLAVALTAVSATFWIHLRRSQAIEQERLRALEAETVARSEREQQVKQLEKEQARLDQQNQELTTLAQSLRAKESAQSSNLTEIARKLAGTTTNAAGNPSLGEGGENGVAGMMEKMMKDPAMREMMRSQQKAMMGQMYGPLFKELGLSADQRQKFSDVLIEGMMKGMDQAGMLFGQDPEKKAEAAKAATEQKKNLDSEIKLLLGDEKFAQYEDYQKTVGERVQLNQFKQQLDGTDWALQENQMSQLLQILKEEKARVPSVIPDGPGRSLEAMEVLRSEEAMSKHFQWQGDLHKRVLERAGQTLSPEQLKDYSGFLDQQLNMQRLGMQMARQMFGGKGNPSANGK